MFSCRNAFNSFIIDHIDHSRYSEVWYTKIMLGYLGLKKNERRNIFLNPKSKFICNLQAYRISHYTCTNISVWRTHIKGKEITSRHLQCSGFQSIAIDRGNFLSPEAKSRLFPFFKCVFLFHPELMVVQPFLSITEEIKSKNGYTAIHSDMLCIKT